VAAALTFVSQSLAAKESGKLSLRKVA